MLGDALAGLLVHEGAAAGSEHDRPFLQEAGDHAALAVAEMVFAMDGEGLGMVMPAAASIS